MSEEKQGGRGHAVAAAAPYGKTLLLQNCMEIPSAALMARRVLETRPLAG
jgi:hypothetical protein